VNVLQKAHEKKKSYVCVGITVREGRALLTNSSMTSLSSDNRPVVAAIFSLTRKTNTFVPNKKHIKALSAKAVVMVMVNE
jgi:hypothetical protein